MLDIFFQRILAIPRELLVPFMWAGGVVLSLIILGSIRRGLAAGSWASLGARFGGRGPVAAYQPYHGWLVSPNILKRSLAVFGYFIIGGFIMKFLVYVASWIYTYFTGEVFPFSLTDIAFW